MTDHMLWHEPKQARSRRRFNQVLDTAAALFAEYSYEAVTTNYIAEQAAIPIGSLYQYFPNKEAILAALVERYIEEMQAVFPAITTPDLPFPQIISHMIDQLMAFELAHAGFSMMFTTLDVVPGMTITHRIHGTIVANVERMLAVYFPQMSAEQRYRCASTGIGIVKGLMILAKPPYALPPEHMLIEVKTALVAYTEAFLQREGLS